MHACKNLPYESMYIYIIHIAIIKEFVFGPLVMFTAGDEDLPYKKYTTPMCTHTYVYKYMYMCMNISYKKLLA